MIRVGAHVDSTDPLPAAAAIDADAAQIFVGDPQAWKTPATTYPDGPEALKEAAAADDVALYVHAPYVINVASPNNRIRIPSRKLLAGTVKAATAIGAAGVIVHGGHVTAGTDDAEGVGNWRKALEALDLTCPVLIENTAGGNHSMARTPDALARLWDTVAPFGVGFCLDTCHAWAGGIPLPEGVDLLRSITGRIDVVHANDSVGALDSGRDRHANFGKGTLGTARILDTIVAARPAAVICETPPAGIADDIALVRARLGELAG